MIVNTKYGEWWSEPDGKPLDPEYFRLLEKIGLLELKNHVVSHHRFLCYETIDFDVTEVVELLKSIPKANTLKDFAKHGWERSTVTEYGCYWAGTREVGSIRKGVLNIPYYYATNLRRLKKIAEKWIKILEQHKGERQ